LKAGLLTVSDRCSAGQAQDRSGPALERLIEAHGWAVAARDVVPDEPARIKELVLRWAHLDLIVTTGGTGLGPRDVTPESVRPLLDKEIPGFGELMRAEGRKSTPLAVLSRSLAGLRGKTLILCVPGSARGAEESFRAVADLIEHALNTAAGAGHP
jgi:molybdenum cofactor synthesis domain-containing protein